MTPTYVKWKALETDLSLYTAKQWEPNALIKERIGHYLYWAGTGY